MQQNITIRRATMEDLEPVLQLDRELIMFDAQFDDTLDMNWSNTAEARAFFESRIKGDEGMLWVGSPSVVPIAYLAAAPTEAFSYRRKIKMIELECLYVAPEYRSSGLGARMVDTCAKWAKENGYERIRVTVSAENSRARTFYAREAFKDWDSVMEREI